MTVVAYHQHGVLEVGKDVYKRQRQKGLEPLAMIMMLQSEPNLTAKAATFVKGDVKDTEDALKGARDIIAEQDVYKRQVEEVK